jgi:hypothetical protein
VAALTQVDRSSAISFCARCGHLSAEGCDASRRVCGECEMGLLLRCAHDALPDAGAAFLVCTHELVVSAVSEAAEGFFGAEGALVGTELLHLVTSPLGDDHVARHARTAAQRHSPPVVMPLRSLSGEAAGVGMLAGRIATCEPPRGALVAVEPSGFGRR